MGQRFESSIFNSTESDDWSIFVSSSHNILIIHSNLNEKLSQLSFLCVELFVAGTVAIITPFIHDIHALPKELLRLDKGTTAEFIRNH